VADLVTVFHSSDLALFALAKAELEDEGIPYIADGEGIQDLFGVGRLGTGYNLITGPPRIRVMAEHAERARALLAELEDEP
jgi:Putative prokaryotic signal transducing protein